MAFFFDRNKEEIADDKLAGVRIFVLGGSREKFSQAEVSASTGITISTDVFQF